MQKYLEKQSFVASIAMWLFEGTLNREGASKYLDHGTVKKVLGKHGCVDGGGHKDHADLGVGLDHIPEDHQQEVRLHRQ